MITLIKALGVIFFTCTLTACSLLTGLLSQHIASGKPLVSAHIGDEKYAAQDNDIHTETNHGHIAGRDHVTINKAEKVVMVSESWYSLVQLIIIIVLTMLVTVGYINPILKYIKKYK